MSLAFRAQPKEIVKRQSEGAKLKLNDATRQPDGELDYDKVGKGLAGVAGVLLLLGILRRARS